MDAHVQEWQRAREEMSFTFQLAASMDDMIHRIGTTAQQTGRALQDFVGGAVQGIAESFSGLLHQTMSWKDALMNVAQTLTTSVINAISRMAAEWIVKRGLIAAKEIFFSGAEAAAKAPGALLTSITSYGTAALIGAAAFAAVMAAVGGFATGGVVGGGEQLIRVNEQGTEGVVNARGMRNIGADGLAAINQGLLNASNLATTIPARLAGGIPAGEGGAGNPSPAGGGSSTIHVLLVDSRNSQAARQFLESSAGRAIVRDVVTDQRQEIGVPT